MGWIFIPLITIAVIFTFLVYFVALDGHRTNKSDNHIIWYATGFCTLATVLIMMLYAGLSSTVLLADIFQAMGIIVFFAMLASFFFGQYYQKKHNQKGKFKKPTLITLGVMIAFSMLVAMTTPAEDNNDAVESNTIVEDETVEEESEEPVEESTTQEEKATDEEEQKAKEEAEKEKAAKEAATKEKEESIEEAKKKEEASIEEEKQKEESIEAEKAEKEKAAEEEKASEKEKEKEEAEKESVPAKEGLIPVNLYRVTDGDTVNVVDNDGSALKLRLLLIDTPETVHPNKPVEPYGKEASARLTELLNNADQLYIEYDNGEKTDHYDRHLVYLYADDVNVHEVLLKEGLARVGYIYEQQRYLSDFREAEQYAKDRQLGIWSIPGYVNEGGEGFNSEEEEPEPEPTNEPATSEPAQSEPATTEQPAQQEFFDNCTDLRGTYPSGVEQGHPAYQPKMDRDKDGYACEVS